MRARLHDLGCTSNRSISCHVMVLNYARKHPGDRPRRGQKQALKRFAPATVVRLNTMITSRRLLACGYFTCGKSGIGKCLLAAPAKSEAGPDEPRLREFPGYAANSLILFELFCRSMLLTCAGTLDRATDGHVMAHAFIL
jgi:hypothetical protein